MGCIALAFGHFGAPSMVAFGTMYGCFWWYEMRIMVAFGGMKCVLWLFGGMKCKLWLCRSVGDVYEIQVW
jgi:hypothetical protein